ncbi:MAG: ATPase, T2SS/T4P/T4SS family [Thermoanaerobaculia bacterium]
MASIDKLLAAALRGQVDAVVLEPGRLPRFKKGSTEHEVTQQPLDGYAIERLLSEIAPLGQLPESTIGARFGFDYEIEGVVLRWTGLGGPLGWTAMASPQAAASPARASSTAVAAAKGSRPLPPIEQLLRSMIELDASDLYLTAWERPHLRIHGEISRFETYEAPTSTRLKELLYEIVPARARGEFEASNDAHFVHEIVDVARFRIHLFRDRQGVAAAARHVPWAVPAAGARGIPPLLLTLADLDRGLAVVAGPTGSGRTTTLAVLAERYASRRRARLVTIEDPIEFWLAGERGLIEQRELGSHVADAAAAIEAARADGADALVLGRLAGDAVAASALGAAAAGLLVFLEAPGLGAGEAIELFLDRFPGERRAAARRALARHLGAIVVQRLVPRRDGGRALAIELVRATPTVRRLVAEDRSHQIAAALAHGRSEGHVSLEAALAELVEDGAVEPRAAWRAAYDRDAFLLRLAEAGHPTDFSREAESLA